MNKYYANLHQLTMHKLKHLNISNQLLAVTFFTLQICRNKEEQATPKKRTS